jgi:hypothetical protein
MILEGRLQTPMRPGTYKDRANRAGGTEFVAPELVRGTLSQGFAFYRSLDHSFARALYLMFLVAEVHPFIDGNGRVERAWAFTASIPFEVFDTALATLRACHAFEQPVEAKLIAPHRGQA